MQENQIPALVLLPKMHLEVVARLKSAQTTPTEVGLPRPDSWTVSPFTRAFVYICTIYGTSNRLSGTLLCS